MHVHFLVVALCLVVAVALAGCGSGSSDTPRPQAGPATTVAPAAGPSQARAPGVNTVAQATVGEVNVFPAPDGSLDPAHTLANPTENGGPLVFLVQEQRADWLLADLPVRPNGSKGWIRASDVEVTRHNYSIVVELTAHQITVRRGEEVILSEAVGVGTSDTPTPGGRYYIKELLKPPNPDTVYGPYAYGLSGFSNTLSTFAGTEAVIGLHGNNDPSALGRDVSAGCIRMSNSGITFLAEILPLGTPVEIVA